MLKLYSLHLGYRGGQAVLADSRSQAWELLASADSGPYPELGDKTEADLVEQDAVAGAMVAFEGDA